MFRITKFTDYGILLLTHFGRAEMGSVLSARQLAESSMVPLTTVSKILKTLVKHHILDSLRGVRGGYRLARSPAEISVSDVITALEGPLALTDCCWEVVECDVHSTCPVGGHWRRINSAIENALDGLTLEELSVPAYLQDGNQLIQLSKKRESTEV